MSSRDPCEAGCLRSAGVTAEVDDVELGQADMHEKLWTALRHGGCDGFLEIPKTRRPGWGLQTRVDETFSSLGLFVRFDIDQYIDYEAGLAFAGFASAPVRGCHSAGPAESHGILQELLPPSRPHRRRGEACQVEWRFFRASSHGFLAEALRFSMPHSSTYQTRTGRVGFSSS